MEKVLVNVRAGDHNYHQWAYNPLTSVVREYFVNEETEDRYVQTWYELDTFVALLRKLIDTLSTELVKEAGPSEDVKG